jgi:HK97 family phage portal protein
VTYSVSDPALAELFGFGARNYSGEPVSESTALTLSAVYRASAIVSGTIASLPMPTFRTTDGDVREKVSSFLDNPAGPDRATPFEWKETALLHLMFGGDMFGLHVTNGGGAVVGLTLVHPLCVGVDWDESYLGGKKFTVTHEDGRTESMGAERMCHIPGPSLDGLRGMSVIAQARNSLGTSLAGDKAAARMFKNGMVHQVLVSSDEDDMPPEEAKSIKDDLTDKLSGTENVGSINVINRRLKLTPFTMSAEDAQFIQSREFQISEVARWFGVPATLLMKDGAVSTWGTGVEIMNAGLHRYTLMPWTTRIEQRLSRLLSSPRFVEFDYSGFIKPAPADEINLLIAQVNSGLLTLNEARRVRNLPPLADPSADLPRVPAGAVAPGQPPATAPEPEVQP